MAAPRAGGQHSARAVPGAPVQGDGASAQEEEPNILLEIRKFATLDKLRLAAKSVRRSRFVGDVAVVICRLRMLACDVLFRNIQCHDATSIISRHQDTATMFNLMRELCSDPSVLQFWAYSADQQEWLVDRLGPVVGHGRHFVIQILEPQPLQMARDSKGSVAPFLTSVMSELVSKEFALLPLAGCLGRASKGAWSRDGTVFVTRLGASQERVRKEAWCVTLAALVDLGGVRIVFEGEDIIQFEFAEPWKEIDRPRVSHFLPPCCRIPPVDERECRRDLDPPFNFARKVPDKDVAYITFSKEAWRRKLGTLPSELETLLDGMDCVSRTGQTFAPMFMRHHPSLDEEALEALWPTIAKMLWKRQFEYVERHHQIPRNVMACGAVPKSTAPFRRLITDYRPSNVFVDPWPVRYISIKGLALLLEHNSLFWTRDLAGAYYNGVLGGCGASPKEVLTWILNSARDGYVPKKSKQFGCGPGDCSNWCEKSLGGVCLGGHIMRLAACQFGAKTSNGPLSLFVDSFMDIVRRYRESVNGVSFVDDLLFYLKLLMRPEEHGRCSGLAGGCALCKKAAEVGAADEEFVDRLLDELHMERSEKQFVLGQAAVFLGVWIDTHEGRLKLTEEKFRKLMDNLQEVLAWSRATPRAASKVRGKLINYSECMESVRPFSVPFTVFIGDAKTTAEWDLESENVGRMRETAAFLISHVPRLVSAGAPLWKLESSTMYDRFERGLELGFELRVVTFDAAIPGVGVAMRDRPGIVKWVRGRRYEGLSTVVTFPRDLGLMGDLEHQAWREAWGAVLAVELALMDESVRDCVLLLINDCVPVLAAIMKGSARSPRLQAATEAIYRACIPRGVVVRTLHASGKQLIEEMVDEGSRRHAQALRGPACGERLRSIVFEFAREVGCPLTIDFFASAENTLCRRYAAWTDDPRAEAVDAFSIRNWDVGRCVCGMEHREWGFYFPPSGLEDRVVRRAQSDGARGVFLVPRNRKAPYFQALRQRAILMRNLESEPGLFIHVRKQMCKHSLIAVDFSGGNDLTTVFCGQESEPRRKGRTALPVEEEAARDLVQQISLLGEKDGGASGRVSGGSC